MVRLDHIGLIVPSLEKAGALFEGLGFTLTRRAEHTRVNARGETESAGSAQRSIMLAEGYIELQEQNDPEAKHLLAAAAAKHSGVHILAFGVDDAERARAEAVARGLPAGEVLDWGRAVAEDDLAGEARFGFFALPYAARDEAFLCWVEHKTPRLLRNTRLTKHANGALALRGVMIETPDWDGAEAIAARYVAAGGRRRADEDGRKRVGLGAADVRIEKCGTKTRPGGYQGARVTEFEVSVGGLAKMNDIGERASALGLPNETSQRDVKIDLGRYFDAVLVVSSAEK